MWHLPTFLQNNSQKPLRGVPLARKGHSPGFRALLMLPFAPLLHFRFASFQQWEIPLPSRLLHYGCLQKDA